MESDESIRTYVNLRDEICDIPADNPTSPTDIPTEDPTEIPTEIPSNIPSNILSKSSIPSSTSIYNACKSKPHDLKKELKEMRNRIDIHTNECLVRNDKDRIFAYPNAINDHTFETFPGVINTYKLNEEICESTSHEPTPSPTYSPTRSPTDTPTPSSKSTQSPVVPSCECYENIDIGLIVDTSCGLSSSRVLYLECNGNINNGCITINFNQYVNNLNYN
eukprot:141908_1